MADQQDEPTADEADDVGHSAGSDDAGADDQAASADEDDDLLAADDGPSPPDEGPDDRVARRERASEQRVGGGLTERQRRRLVVGCLVVLTLMWQEVKDDGDDRPGEHPLAAQLAAGAGRSPGQTVSAFFHAQAAGDCERLVDDLITEDSWSDGGRLTRRQFLDRCADAVDGYQPVVGEVQIDFLDTAGVASEGDRATVSIAATGGADVVDGGDPYTDGGRGTLVREDGEWKVETDPAALHVGPSVEETVAAYVAAYDQGDCATITGLLSEDVWSQGGDLDRDEFVQACGQDADRRRERAQPTLHVMAARVSIEHDGRATAAIEGRDPSLTSIVNGPAEEATFTRDGFRWTIDRAEESPGTVPWVPFGSVLRSEIQAELVDSFDGDGLRCLTYGDDAVSLMDGQPGVRREYPGCATSVTMYRLGNPDEAQAFVAEWVEELYPLLEPVPVPGVPDAVGIRSGCAVDGCQSTIAIASAGGHVVIVELHDETLTTTTAVLQAQLEVLS